MKERSADPLPSGSVFAKVLGLIPLPVNYLTSAWATMEDGQRAAIWLKRSIFMTSLFILLKEKSKVNTLSDGCTK
jgi:hypothetical protein